MGSLGATAAFVSAAPLDAETARCSAAACVVQVGAVFFRELRTRNSHAFSPPLSPCPLSTSYHPCLPDSGVTEKSSPATLQTPRRKDTART